LAKVVAENIGGINCFLGFKTEMFLNFVIPPEAKTSRLAPGNPY
jgi:hypothetical protein